MSGNGDLLTRLARSEHFVASSGAAPSGADGDDEAEAKRRRLGRLIRALDIGATVFWVYAIIKVFIADIDRAVVEAIAPGALPLLGYRVFLYLGLLVALFVFWRRLWWIVLYFAFFPVLLVLWKIPWFFMKRKSWPFAFAGLQTVFSVVSQLRYHLVHKTLWLFGAVLILAVDAIPVLVSAATLIIILLVISYYRAVRSSFAPSGFITLQRRGIRRLLNSGPFRQFVALKDEYKRTDSDRFAATEAIEVANTISYGVIATRGLYLWAYQLQRYRSRYSPSLVFAAISFAWLFVGTVLSLWLANWAVLSAFPNQYAVAGEPSLAGMLVYALSGVALSDGGGVQAAGDIAFALRLFAGFAGAVFLLAVFVNVVLTIRRERDETAIKELVDELKRHGRAQEAWFESEYAVTVEEANIRLIAIDAGLASILRYFAEAIPADFYQGEKSDVG